jgi:hypothetical protein
MVCVQYLTNGRLLAGPKPVTGRAEQFGDMPMLSPDDNSVPGRLPFMLGGGVLLQASYSGQHTSDSEDVICFPSK